MADDTRTRARDAEPHEPDTRLYEPFVYEHSDVVLKRMNEGRVVIKRADRPWDMHRQAKSRRYMSPLEPELQDTCLQDWEIFLQIFPDRSGKHTHQGGLVIFILEGTGYSVYNGERHDWEAGDLLLLPMTPGGIEHQHFNLDPDRPAQWIAFVYWPLWTHAGSEIRQQENNPLYDAWIENAKEDTWLQD